MQRLRYLIFSLFLVLASPSAQGEEILVAVASNFTAPMMEIAAAFEADSGHEVALAFGSSGRIFAQISNGAPFQIFFSADQEKPAALEENGLAVAGSRFTYAIGSLVLWSADVTFEIEGPEALTSGSFDRLALANPRLAPYGQAALAVLENLGAVTATRGKWVQGENIAQTFQFVASGNAQLGFVALSQIVEDGRLARGSGWVVPAELHTPIRQDAVLLSAADCQACRHFMAFVRGDRAQTIIARYGYRLE